MAFFDFFKKEVKIDTVKSVSNEVDRVRNTEDAKNIPVSQTDSIMGPGQPRDENTDLERLFQYAGSFNQVSKPRAYEENSFEELRFLAANPLIRSCIQQRKDQIYSMNFEVRNIDDKITEKDDRSRKVEKLLKRPSANNPSWRNFVSCIIEDMLVCDAVYIKPKFNLKGEVVNLDLIAPENVSLKINNEGKLPEAPQVAYQTVFNGTTELKDYTVDQVMMIKTNSVSNSVYGKSLVEQVFDTIELYLLRQLNVKSYLTEGNLPDSMIEAPEKWLPSQVAQYQQYWNELYNQNNLVTKKQRVKFVPNGMNLIQAKSPELKQDIDEFLARQICAVFGVPPTAYTKDTNKATADTLNEMSKDTSLRSLVKNIEEEMTKLIQFYIGYEDLEFVFTQEQNSDGLKEAQENNLYKSSGILTTNEIRKKMGYGAIEGGDTLQNNSTSPTGENRQIGQADPQSQEAEAKPEIENPNDKR